MRIRPEVKPFLAASAAVGGVVLLTARACGAGWGGAVAGGLVGTLIPAAYMVWFFRDPDRTPPRDPSAIVAGADGIVARIAELREADYLHAQAVRISIFLRLYDVHVNRAPLSGRARFLGYFPGRRYFTFQEKSSLFNQHNGILIEGEATRCLVRQIAGPVCRRVVYWPARDRDVALAAGDRIGMMKFGSRLDMLFPKDDVDVVAKEGDRVRAGETVVARVR